MVVAVRAAKQHGTELRGNMRWRGMSASNRRDAVTADGRLVVVYEPDALIPMPNPPMTSIKRAQVILDDPDHPAHDVVAIGVLADIEEGVR